MKIKTPEEYAEEDDSKGPYTIYLKHKNVALLKSRLKGKQSFSDLVDKILNDYIKEISSKKHTT